MKQFEEAEGEKKVRCTKIRVGHPKYKTVDFFLFYTKENVTLLRRRLSGVVYHRASFWRCLQRKKVCGFVYLLLLLFYTHHLISVYNN